MGLIILDRPFDRSCPVARLLNSTFVPVVAIDNLLYFRTSDRQGFHMIPILRQMRIKMGKSQCDRAIVQAWTGVPKELSCEWLMPMAE